MIDFNTILSAAITASINTAIEQAVTPLKAQIEELQTRLNATQATLPGSFAELAGTVARMEENMAAMNSRVQQDTVSAKQIDLAALDNQEWFWAKIGDYVDTTIGNIDFSEAISDAFSNSSIVEDAVEHYIKDYDFSEIVADNVEGVVENQLSNYDFREIVGDILEDARITL